MSRLAIKEFDAVSELCSIHNKNGINKKIKKPERRCKIEATAGTGKLILVRSRNTGLCVCTVIS